MSKRLQAIVVLLFAAAAPGGSIAAQQPAPAAKPAATTGQVPLKLQFLLSKYQGEKKISSLPYTLTLNSNDQSVELRVGAQVPTPTTVVKDGNSTPTYTYNQIGVSITCSVKSLDDGIFSVSIRNLTDSSIFMNSASGSSPSANLIPFINGVPVFKNFSISGNILLLKDGQTSQLTAAADPTTGDVMRVDVTLSVIK